MTGPSFLSIRNYSCHTLALTTFFNHPGDGRTQPVIPASDLSWALLVGGILRLGSANRLEWLAHCGHRKDLGLTRKFGDDALAYFSERVDPEVIRPAGGHAEIGQVQQSVGRGGLHWISH